MELSHRISTGPGFRPSPGFAAEWPCDLRQMPSAQSLCALIVQSQQWQSPHGRVVMVTGMHPARVAICSLLPDPPARGERRRSAERQVGV